MIQMAKDAGQAQPQSHEQMELAFYIAANDRDMLHKINQLMARNGCVGIMDTAGRLHYLIDGRRGAPYASRRILETAGRILCDRQQSQGETLRLVYQVVDRTLEKHGIRTELKGYHYLRFILLAVGLDDTQIRPVSKTVYPMVAERFRVHINQVERDIRYALQGSDLYRQGLTPTASICRLHLEMVQTVEHLQMSHLDVPEQSDSADNEEKPFRAKKSSEGSLVNYEESGHPH